MSDDKKMSQLISLSLRRELSSEESASIEKHLSANDESRKFAELSQLIQKSVSGDQVLLATQDDPAAALSQDSKQRLKESVVAAVKEKLSQSQIDRRANAAATDAHPKSDRLDHDPLSQTLATSTGRGGSSQGSPDVTNEKREVISRFSLIRRLGHGGLGNVWLARDEQLNRNVAIKELNSEALESPKAWERFYREAEITGHLEHPNIVPLYQYGVDRKSGEPFYAMRFVGKRTLANAIEEHHDRIEIGEDGALSLYRLLNVFLDICQAIAYAHSHGVIHRDLKPENVGLDNFGQVIVLDWGLAKVLEDSELASQVTSKSGLNDSNFAQTMHGEVVGTPLYMSPEQAAGELEKIDERTDVYGLGAILFSILTGMAPHENSVSGQASNVSSVLKQIAEAETPRAKAHNKHVPSELDAICAKAMARKQHLRFEGVQRLSVELESWIAGQSQKHAGYETLRMEGRELRSDMQSSVRDLERNVRFASGLPPVLQLIQAASDADIAEWRGRLSSIFQGMLKANPNYRGIAYSKIEGGEFTELVRVERHSHDATTIRTVPKSRLKSSQANEFISTVTRKLPEEVHTSLVCNPNCEMTEGCEKTVGLLAGVPVYDDQTEEVFGFVAIHCDFEQMLREQMSRRLSAGEVVVACDTFHVMMHLESGKFDESSVSKPVAEVGAHFLPAVAFLQENTDFIDDKDSEIYGARLWLVPNRHGVMYLLKRDK